jgi:hypothetical protein
VPQFYRSFLPMAFPQPLGLPITDVHQHRCIHHPQLLAAHPRKHLHSPQLALAHYRGATAIPFQANDLSYAMMVALAFLFFGEPLCLFFTIYTVAEVFLDS